MLFLHPLPSERRRVLPRGRQLPRNFQFGSLALESRDSQGCVLFAFIHLGILWIGDGRILREPVVDELEEASAEEGGARNREDPGEDDAAPDAPTDSGKAARGSNAYNGAGDGVRGANRNAEDSVHNERGAASGFRGKATEGSELGDALAHGLDDAPAAGHGAAAHS